MVVAGGRAVKALALNAGSSSLKAALYDVEPGAALAAPARPVWEAAVDGGLGAARALLDERLRCRRHAYTHGLDAPDVVEWVWQA